MGEEEFTRRKAYSLARGRGRGNGERCSKC